MDQSQSRKTILIALVVLALAVIFYVFTLEQKPQIPQAPRPEDVALENIKSLIINQKDCKDALPMLTGLIQTLPNYAPAWHWQGVCQFQTGKLAEAKASFIQALVLDANDQGAQSYLKNIEMQSKPGTVSVGGAEVPISQKIFETKIGLVLSGILKFTKAVRSPSNISDYLVATYTSTGTYSQTLTYLRAELTKAKFQYQSSDTQNGSTTVVFTDTARKFFDVVKGSPVTVTIRYVQLK